MKTTSATFGLDTQMSNSLVDAMLKFPEISSTLIQQYISVLRTNFNMRDPNNPCLFCNFVENDSAHENDLAYSSYDTYPVADLHCLVIPKRHVKDYFDLTNEELIACNDLIKITKDEIIKKDKSVTGFNIGTNVGKVSGHSNFLFQFYGCFCKIGRSRTRF